MQIRHILTMAQPWACSAGLILALSAQGPASAEETDSGGIVGWFYYHTLSRLEQQYLPDPVLACQITAHNHFRVPLVEMKRMPNGIDYYCFYDHPSPLLGALALGSTVLKCKPDYTTLPPGVCVKNVDIPRPANDCDPSGSGFTLANPVVISTGSKVQSEIDLAGGPDGSLTLGRTYRSLRAAQDSHSGSNGWSFSFDRHFTVIKSPNESLPRTVSGTFGDGSYFEFSRKADGAWISRYDHRQTLRPLSADFNDWALTTSDGQVERFKNMGDVFRLTSTHRKDGLAQFHAYDQNKKLKSISDAHGRALELTWSGDQVSSVSGPAGSTRYLYTEMELEGQAVPGMPRLTKVEFLDQHGIKIASRMYHL